MYASLFRDWSLITGRGGYKPGGGSFTPMRRGGGKSFSHAEGGGTKSFGVVFMRKLEVLAILMGERIKFPLFERGGAKSFTLSSGGAQKVSDPRFSHFVAAPPPPPAPHN